jgi:hypothetical protein
MLKYQITLSVNNFSFYSILIYIRQRIQLLLNLYLYKNRFDKEYIFIHQN